jgi:hypothetical protein
MTAPTPPAADSQLDKIVDIGGEKPKATILDELEALIVSREREAVLNELQLLPGWANGCQCAVCKVVNGRIASLSKEAQQ